MLPGVLGAHVQLLAQGLQRHLQILDQRVGFVLGVEGVLVRVLHRVLGAVVDLAQRRGEVGPLQLGEGVGHQHRLHELLRHAHVEERPLLLALAHLDDAALLVEVDVGEAAHRDGKRGILAAIGCGDHRVRHADELLLDHPGDRGLLRLRSRHGSVLPLLLPHGRFRGVLRHFGLARAGLRRAGCLRRAGRLAFPARGGGRGLPRRRLLGRRRDLGRLGAG